MKKILFRTAYLYHLSTLLPIYNIVKNDSIYDIFFTLPFKERMKRFHIFQKDTSHNYQKYYNELGLKIKAKNETFDIVITGDVLDEKEDYGNAKIIIVNHGTGIKNVFYRLLRKQPNRKYYIMVEGPYRKQKIIENNAVGKSKIYTVGYPKLDPVFNNDITVENYRKNFIINPDKKTVLYAPTYKPSSIPYLKDYIIRETLDYNLIIKLHPYSWKGKYAPHSHHRIFKRKLSQFKHFVLVPENYYDILPFLIISDVIVTDASSTIFEFLALNKTGVIFDIDPKKLYHSDGEKLLHESSDFLHGVFEHIQSGEQLRNAISTALKIDEKKENLIEKYQQQLFYKLDGQASQRIINIIESEILES